MIARLAGYAVLLVAIVVIAVFVYGMAGGFVVGGAVPSPCLHALNDLVSCS